VNLGALYFAWATGGIGMAVVAACFLIPGAVRHLAQRYRRQRDRHQWHQTAAIHDHALREAADRVLRDAERDERRQP
jgi:hypothetical protein